MNEQQAASSAVISQQKASKARPWKITARRLARDKYLYVLALPALIYFALFKYVPMWGVSIAFMDYSPYAGIMESPWVGFKHFERFFSHPDFWILLIY
jgi:putative aldouronate transport system permease protein